MPGTMFSPLRELSHLFPHKPRTGLSNPSSHSRESAQREANCPESHSYDVIGLGFELKADPKAYGDVRGFPLSDSPFHSI